jgi:hypothetical protein
MTLKELEKLIDEEVSKISIEPIREPQKELPATPIVKLNPVFNPVLETEEEIDEILFRAGMKPKK